MNDRGANSLQIAWGLNKQDHWQFLKKLTILAATKYYQQDNPTYEQFYRFIADKRHEIAVVLNQEDAYQIGIPRTPDMDMYTVIQQEGRYACYFEYLLNRYNEISKDTGIITLHPTPLSFFKEGYHYTFISGEACKINTGKGYIGLLKYHYLDDRRQKKIVFEVWNPKYKQRSVLDKKIDGLYDILFDMDSNEKKIRIIHQMSYYQAVAGKSRRGSAAITEIFTEALLNANKINMDLKAKPLLIWKLYFLFHIMILLTEHKSQILMQRLIIRSLII